MVSSQGGESFPVSSDDLEIHAFAWSANSHWIYFAARDELTNEQNAAYLDEWKDVIQYRESERRDTVFGVEVASKASRNIAKSNRMTRSPKPSKIATVPYRIDQIAASPDGNFLALTTSSRSGRLNSSEPHGVYVVDLPNGGAPRLVLHTLGPPDPWAAASDAWSPDSLQILFSYGFGTPEGPFQTPQTRLYAISLKGGKSVGGRRNFAVTWKAIRSPMMAASLGRTRRYRSQSLCCPGLRVRPCWAVGLGWHL